MADAPTPGASTSEYKLASRTWWVSLAVTLIGLVIDPLLTAIQKALTGDASAHPENVYLAVACVGFGLLSKAITSAYYSWSRGTVKAAAAALFLIALLLPVGCASSAAKDQAAAYTDRVGTLLDESEPGPSPPGVDPLAWAAAWKADRDALKREGADIALAFRGPKPATATAAVK
jgi:hypothetical protein